MVAADGMPNNGADCVNARAKVDIRPLLSGQSGGDDPGQREGRAPYCVPSRLESSSFRHSVHLFRIIIIGPKRDLHCGPPLLGTGARTVRALLPWPLAPGHAPPWEPVAAGSAALDTRGRVVVG